MAAEPPLPALLPPPSQKKAITLSAIATITLIAGLVVGCYFALRYG